jgi:hypothetical protein
MKCGDVNNHWEDYLNGRYTENVEQQIDKHIEHCDVCRNRLEQDAMKEQPIPNQDEWNKKGKKIIRNAKLKNRLSTFFMFILFIIGLVMASSLLTSIFYTWNDKIERANLVNQTFFQMTSSNIVLQPMDLDTTPFFKVNYEYDVQKLVGREMKKIGTHEPSLLLNHFTNIDYPLAYSEGVSLTDIYFVNRNIKANYSKYKSAWQTLEKLHEGTVSEVGVTFSEGLTYHELLSMISNYDISLAWAGIETDRFEAYEYEIMYVGHDVIGMNENSLFYLSHTNGVNSINNVDGEIRERIVKDSLNYLIENKKYLKQLNRLSSIKAFDAEAALTYIEENGVNLYGAILTGPTKELLKLQNEEKILFATMGEVDFWNWDKW